MIGRFFAFVLQPRAGRGGAAVLPDDGVMDGRAGFAIPDDGRFALVGDADGGDIGDGRAVEGAADDFQRRLPDFFGVVFDPAVLRIELLVFGLRGFQRRAVGIEENGSARRRSLIDRKNFAALCGHVSALAQSGI